VTDTPTERADESTWTRLRRRKVVQWGLVYVAAAWGFLQGLEYVTETFQWPVQLRQIAFLALLIGLPVVLVLAWYHGDRGQQRITTPEFAILTLLLLLGGGAFWYYQRTGEAAKDAAPKASTAQRDASPGIRDTRPSIAVLPFENRSREADDVFFVDGIHDDILTQLTKVGALKVIARTSVEQFRDTKLTTREIGEKLGVTKVLEGGVQRAGDRVRVTVQLIDAPTDAHLWAESYDHELTAANIFAIQSDVAAAIADALKATLTASEKARVDAVSTQNLQAWEAYQLGRQRLVKRTSTGLIESEKFFRRALELDPKFALAYCGLADSLSLRLDYTDAPIKATLQEAQTAVDKALELDPELSDAWASSGLIASYREKHVQAVQMYRRAIELNPNNAMAFKWYANSLSALGHTDEGYHNMERAADLDPLSAIIQQNLAIMLEYQGRFADAESHFLRTIEIDPLLPAAYEGLSGLTAYARNRFADAVPLAQKALELDPGDPGPTLTLADLYLDLGDEQKFVVTMEQAEKRWPEHADVLTWLAFVDLYQGDEHGLMQHAQRSFDEYPRRPVALVLQRDAYLKHGRYDAALTRYEKAFPEFFAHGAPRIDGSNYQVAVDLALVHQRRGDSDRAAILLDGAARFIRTIPRLGANGYWLADVQIHALRGQKAEALAALREAEQAGWRGWWRYYRDFDPNLASIRNEPEFKAVFADIERDMAQQRAALAARPKDAPLELTDASR
jgi:TolB-like protein/Tfp pilus assembly protein PilF